MTGQLVGNVTCGLKVNLRMKTPRPLSLRFAIAKTLISLAAFILKGRLIVEAEPEITSAILDKNGRLISEKTERI